MSRLLVLAALFGATGLCAVDYLPPRPALVVWSVCLLGLGAVAARVWMIREATSA